MDCGSVAGEKPKRLPGRRRLLLFLAAGRGGSPGGRGVPARRLVPTLPGGLGALRPRGPAARASASRASPLFLVLLVPFPRLAAAGPRRPLANWERWRAGPSSPPAGRGGAWRWQPGLAPRVACAAGALHLCLRRVAALASSRRGEGRAGAAGAGLCAPEGGSAEVAGLLPAAGTKVCRAPPFWSALSWAPSAERIRVSRAAGAGCRAQLLMECGAGELSLSAGSLQLEGKRREFTSSGSRKLYFDTHALVCLLEENGFTTRQAEIIVSALVKITETNMDVVYKDMVTKMQQEITLQQLMAQIANVKKDMIILEKSEFSALRSENEKIKLELHRLKQQVMDEVIKVRTETKLDFNLEKSRVKELHAQQDRAITQTDRKIDTEVAGLKTMLESHKLDNIKYLAGKPFCILSLKPAENK
uniref:Mitochondrial calcium uniporter regulator 1 n=1 Tax=Sus scrofa TaxID=9823 RepID=A0A8D1CAD2_PIG